MKTSQKRLAAIVAVAGTLGLGGVAAAASDSADDTTTVIEQSDGTALTDTETGRSDPETDTSDTGTGTATRDGTDPATDVGDDDTVEPGEATDGARPDRGPGHRPGGRGGPGGCDEEPGDEAGTEDAGGAEPTTATPGSSAEPETEVSSSDL